MDLHRHWRGPAGPDGAPLYSFGCGWYVSKCYLLGDIVESDYFSILIAVGLSPYVLVHLVAVLGALIDIHVVQCLFGVLRFVARVLFDACVIS